MVTRLTARAGLGADRRMVFGIARSLALLLSLDVAVLRLAFVGATIAAPPLIACYPCAGLLVLGLRRSRVPARLAGIDPHQLVGVVGVLGVELGAIFIARQFGPPLPVALTVTILTLQFALALGWRRLELSERWSWFLGSTDGQRSGLRPARLSLNLLAAVLGGLGAWLFINRQNPFNDVSVSVNRLVPYALLAAAAAVAFLPTVLRFGSTFSAERRERIRADERAKLATHLHDSVLQTLTLIQRHSDDPADVATLARSQERELRDWLYGGVASADSGRLKDRLTALAAEIETRYRWRVELIVVGDADVDTRGEQLLAATREAMVNAARHSEAAQCDVYAECRPDGVQLFVRDRGVGFDQATVADDRRGLADSVVARMVRVGGSAAVRSGPQTGTEVALELPVTTRVTAAAG